MEFDFTSLAFGGEQHIVAWDAKRIGTLKPDDLRNLTQLLDVFGKKSAFAQGLANPITDIFRLRTTDQRLYLYMYRQSAKTVVLGGLKVGSKRLFVRTLTADLREIEPVCVLDFYVHESCQRQGIGKALFEHFLNTEGIDPACIAYDRPSPKLIAFLRKHYGLQDYVPQSNNYVVFNRYFDLNPPHAGGGSRGSGQGRLSSRGSVGTPLGTPSIHPLHGPRATPPPMPPAQPPPPIHPGWMAAPATPSAVGPPPPLGNSPSFGRRWAANNFGQMAPQPGNPSGGGLADEGPGASFGGSGGGGGGYGGSGSGGGYGAPPGFATGDIIDAGSYLQQHPQQDGDSLDAFSRSHFVGGQPPLNQHQSGRLQAPWDAPGPGPQGTGAPAGLPPASRGGAYSSRPPYAVDDSSTAGPSGHGHGMGPGGAYGASPGKPPLPERLGTGAGAPARGPLHTILHGGSGRDAGSGGGPHTRALQQQLAAMQQVEGVSLDGSLQPAPAGYGGTSTPAAGARPGSGERGAARIMAVAQRSGAGAADCLVW